MSVLRAYGDNFDVDEFLDASDLEPCIVYYKDDPKWGTNGFHVSFSDADFGDLETLVDDAITFLQKYQSELKRLNLFLEVENTHIDFPLEQRDVFMFSDTLPAKLLALAGNLGIDIVMSYYPSSESEKD